MYFITTKRMLEVCFLTHPNIQYRTFICYTKVRLQEVQSQFNHFLPGDNFINKLSLLQ
jgi:hypothetical protein